MRCLPCVPFHHCIVPEKAATRQCRAKQDLRQIGW
jgi:hypothetical protein